MDTYLLKLSEIKNLIFCYNHLSNPLGTGTESVVLSALIVKYKSVTLTSYSPQIDHILKLELPVSSFLLC